MEPLRTSKTELLTETVDAIDGLPLVTIAIPTYGQAGFVVTAIESALAQDYPALEVLVVDDASPDHTPDVTARYATDPRVRVVRHATNLGRVATYRDTLMNEARGAFYLNLDGDDWLCEPTFISEAAEILRQEPNVCLVFANVRTFHEATGTFEDHALDWGFGERVVGNELFLLYSKGMAVPHPAALFRRSEALSAGFYEHDVIGADSISFLGLLPGKSAAYLDRTVAVWRQHDKNASVATDARLLIENFAVADVASGARPAVAEFDAETLKRWNRDVSALLGYRAMASQLVGGRPGGAARLAGFMARNRPSAFIRALGLLLGGGLRYAPRWLGMTPMPSGHRV